MPYPSIYAVTYSYTGFSQAQGDNSFPGTQIDADFAGIDATLTNLSAFMQTVIRSDGQLNNGIVTYDSLSPSLQTAGLAPATAWLTATFYAVGKSVIINGNLYRALVAHTSGVFATDLAAAKWLLVAALPSGGAFADGTAVAPAVTWSNETSSGWYRIAAGRLGVSIGGVAKFEMNATDFLLPGAPTTALGAATKAYVDAIVAVQDAMVFKGVIDCSASPNYPAADSGWTYRVSVAGKIGGASGVVVQNGDILICQTDGTAAGTQAAVGASWAVVQANIDGALISANNLNDVTTPATARTNLGLAIGTNVQAFDAQLFSNIPQNSQSVNYNLVLTDAQREIFHPAADTTARNWTIPANSGVAFPVGTVVPLTGESLSGAITLLITTDTLVWLPSGGTGTRTLTAPFSAAIKKITSTKWHLVGTGIT